MAPLIILIFLLFTVITNTLLVHSTKYQINSLQLPISNSCTCDKFNIKSVSFVNLNIFHIPTIHKPSTDRLEATSNKYMKYTLYKSIYLSPSQLNNIIMNINTNTISNAQQQNICYPSYLILPIINNDINIKCIYNEENPIINIMSYNCNPSILISNPPNTTIFYPMDNEYKIALKKYNEQYRISRRRLNDNNYNTTTTVEIADINNPQKQTQIFNKLNSMRTMLIWLLIGAGMVCIPSTCCLAIYCIKIKRDNKKINMEDIGANQSESEALYNKHGIHRMRHLSIPNILSPASAMTVKSASITSINSDIDGNIETKSISLLAPNNSVFNEYTVVPIEEDDDIKPAKSRSSINIIEMAHIVHGTQCDDVDDDDSSYDLSQENSEEKQVSVNNTEVDITSDHGKSNILNIHKRDRLIIEDDTEPIKPRKTCHHRNRQRLYTDSFTMDIISNAAESVYSAHSLPTTDDDGRSCRSGYDNDNEDDDDIDDNDDDDIDHIPIISPQISPQIPPNWIKSKSLQNRYIDINMEGLPDEEEEEFDSDDATEIAKKVRSVHRRSSSLGDLMDKRRDSGDIDHDKLYKNWWGTSIPLHEGSLIEGNEELKKHKFFYHAPKIKIKRKNIKKESFKIRIKEDTNAVKELEDDVINQMITDSEMSGADSLV